MKTKKITILNKLKRIYYRIRKLIGFPIENTNSRHLTNLDSKNSIELNGKKYYKVNLRFVDTLDSDSTRFLFQLEEEIESLRLDNFRLTNLNSCLVKKNQDMETLNVNLLNENRIQSVIFNDKTKRTQERFVETEKKLNGKIRENKDLINSIQNTLQEKNETIKDNNLKIKTFQTQLKQKEKEIRILQKNFSNRNEIEKNSDGEKTGFLKKINVINKELNLKDNLIAEKDLLIKALTDKLFVNEKKINALKEYIGSTKTEIKYRDEKNQDR